MTPHALAISQRAGPALADTGGRFLISPEMAAEAQPLGLQAAALARRGRVGALGEVPADVAAAVLGRVPDRVVELTWRESAAVPADAAVHGYRAAGRRWARRHLSSLPGAHRLTTLAEEGIDCAEASGLPLFAGWRAQPRPEQPAERAAHDLLVLAELRGGVQFAALRSHGLGIPIAMLADPRGGLPSRMQTAWQPEDIDNLQQRAATIADLARRWTAAEQDTDAAFADTLDVLSQTEQTELANLVNQADLASRPQPPPAAAPIR